MAPKLSKSSYRIAFLASHARRHAKKHAFDFASKCSSMSRSLASHTSILIAAWMRAVESFAPSSFILATATSWSVCSLKISPSVTVHLSTYSYISMQVTIKFKWKFNFLKPISAWWDLQRWNLVRHGGAFSAIFCTRTDCTSALRETVIPF